MGQIHLSSSPKISLVSLRWIHLLNNFLPSSFPLSLVLLQSIACLSSGTPVCFCILNRQALVFGSTLFTPVCTFYTVNSMLRFHSNLGVFGMGLAANDALCTVLLVEFVGLHRLTNGLGICFFCQGVANILGPPLIGKYGAV